MATHGTTFRLIMPPTAIIYGAKMASLAFQTCSRTFASLSHLWNGKDKILKERLFGLRNGEGNHGEDVKELYYYLDNIPTHSYMEYLYKYPQAEFPYDKLREENRKRSRLEPEYEILDTGIFNDNQYFDVKITYAKQSPKDIFITHRYN